MSVRYKNYGEIWSSTWLWEISSILLGGVCFALTLVLLKIYDQRAPPQFIYGITLNALISILTTFSKSTILVVVAGAISQLKWRWFQNENGKSVLDTQLFDDASRGPWGSAVLLATPHTWSLVSMGALVSIFALALDPFAQQLLSYPTQQVIATDATTQASNILQAASFVVGDTSRSRSDMTNRVIASLWDPETEAEGFAAVKCPTGNCAWDDFESLAMCTPCQNRTSDIGLPDVSLSWNAALGRQALESIAEGTQPNQYVNWRTFSLHFPSAFPCDIDASRLQLTGTVSLSLSKSYSYSSRLEYPSHLFGASIPYQVYVDNTGLNVSTDIVPLLRFCYIQIQRMGNNITEKLSIKDVTTCQLIPCVKRYSYSISNGVPALKVTGERYGSWSFNASTLTLFGGQISYLPIFPSWTALHEGNRQTSNLSNETLSLKTFRIDNFNVDQFREIGSLFQGGITAVDNFADDKRNIVSNNTGIQFKQEFFRGSDSSLTAGNTQLQQIADNGGLSWFIASAAARLSRYMREKDAIPVSGRSYATITIVEVRWPWVSLLAVVWLCAAAFLILTMWICRGSHWVLWKTSSLPWIYHGLESHCIDAIKATATGIDNVSGMEKFAKTLRATLRKDPTNGQFKLTMTR
ncbi:hypothetical protein HD806DRAFT_492396 [Xylariaceae sp. AK1471]|nr:hypothetical protein HD806DRAFT_492396 [Xylariaceae sp. AK1471]